MPPFTESNTIYCNCNSLTSTTTTTSPTIYTAIGPSSISIVHENTEETVKKYCDKVDQHVDKLEEDIEFLNEKRLSHGDLLEILVNANIEKDNKIKALEGSVTYLKNYTSHLEALIHLLEDKVK